MVELQAVVGRRTAELCGLRWDCLRIEEVLDETGAIRPAPVLVHDMPKVAVRRYQLPIDAHAAEIIRAQQARVRQHYPDTPTSQLMLFPALARNPRGVKPFNRVTFAERLRVWVTSCPVSSAPTATTTTAPRSRPTRSGTPTPNATPTPAPPSRCSPP